MSIKYIKLPIYSVALFGQYLYFAGGGGGSTGIPNQIKIYHRNITNQETQSILTDKYIIENMTVNQERKIMVCNANQWVVVYQVAEGGKILKERERFQADFSHKHGNVNGIALAKDASVVMTAGQDHQIRFYNISIPNQPFLVYQHGRHNHQIKSVDHNHDQLWVSTDNHTLVVCNLPKKQIIRTLHNDQLQPSKTLLRSSYFIEKGSSILVITHFTPRTATYVSKELSNGQVQTIEVAEDQVSQTTYHSQHRLLGVACANGITAMVSTKGLSVMGSQNNLKSGVNTCVITKKQFMISATSNCSYHIQAPEGSISLPWPTILALLLTTIFLLLTSTQDPWEL